MAEIWLHIVYDKNTGEVEQVDQSDDNEEWVSLESDSETILDSGAGYYPIVNGSEYGFAFDVFNMPEDWVKEKIRASLLFGKNEQEGDNIFEEELYQEHEEDEE
jgi:hypothetical protein